MQLINNTIFRYTSSLHCQNLASRTKVASFKLLRGFQRNFLRVISGCQVSQREGLNSGLSGPISRNIAILSLRYPYHAIPFSSRLALTRMVRYQPLVVSLTQAHLCHPPFCNILRDDCAILHKIMEFFRGAFKWETTLLHFSKCSKPFLQSIKSTLLTLRIAAP